MYKSTTDAKHYLDQAGSHSLRPSRTGDNVEHPNRETLVFEEIYQEAKAQREATVAEISKVEQRLIKAKNTLKLSQSWEKYKQTEAEVARFGTVKQELQQTLNEQSRVAILAGRNAWGAVFWEIAFQMLPREVFFEINDSVKEVLGRTTVEVNTRSGDKTAKNRRDQLRKKRNRFNDFQGSKRLNL